MVLEDSDVFAEERGLLNRLGEVFAEDGERQREVYRLATERLDRAAQETELLARAEDNTRQLLTGLLRSLGYDDLTVDFDAADAT